MTVTLSTPRNLSFLAYLAWPGGEAKTHDRFIKSGVFLAYKAQGVEPRNMPLEITAIPGTPARKEDVINRGLKLIRERRIAAAYLFLRLSEGRRNDFFKYRGADTINEALESWWSLIGQAATRDVELRHSSDFNNARARIWRDSVPLLPMTLALMFSKESIATLFNRADGASLAEGDVKMDGPLADGWPFVLSHTHWVDTALDAMKAVPIADPKHFVLPGTGPNVF